jgi:hypothetical protein
MNCLGKMFDKKHKIDCICNQNQFEMSLGMLLQLKFRSSKFIHSL